VQNTGSSSHPPPPADSPATDGSSRPQLASRGERGLAAVIDFVVLIPVAYPFFNHFGVFHGALEGASATVEQQATGTAIAFLATLAVNGWLLHTSGQTVGKRIVGIQIVDASGQVPPFQRIVALRMLPFWLLNAVPLVGEVAALANPLLIFGPSRRCLHDYVAGTLVVRAAA